MSRTIFVEALLWVLKARLTGDRAVRQLPAGQPSAATRVGSRQP